MPHLSKFTWYSLLLVAPMLLLSLWRNSLECCSEEKIDPAALMGMHVEMLSRGLARNRT